MKVLIIIFYISHDNNAKVTLAGYNVGTYYNPFPNSFYSRLNTEIG